MSPPTARADRAAAEQIRQVLPELRRGLGEPGVFLQRAVPPLIDRTKAEVERYFDGLEIVTPYEGAGQVVTFTGLWGAEDPAAADSDGSRWLYAAVAHKP